MNILNIFNNFVTYTLKSGALRWILQRCKIAGYPNFSYFCLRFPRGATMIDLKMKAKRILYLLASPTWGGGEEYVYRLMEAIHDRETFAVTMGSANARKLSAVAPADHLFDFRVGSLFDLRAAWRIARIVRRGKIDLIHVNQFAHGFVALWARALSGRKPRVVLTRHLIRRGKGGMLYNWLYRRLDALVFVSDIARRAFLSGGARVPDAKMHTLHHGVPDLPQQPATHNRTQVPTIVFSGRLAPEKGVETLIDALAALQGYAWQVRILGTGDERYVETLRAQARRQGIGERIAWRGFTDDVNGALQGARIGVAPSVVAEAFGLTIVEYMRAGLAVVTTDNGAQPEFVTHGKDALLVPPSDARALSDALKLLLEAPERRERLGVAARKTFLDRLTIDRHLNKLTAIYDSLCE